jgi:hypothetical protein
MLVPDVPNGAALGRLHRPARFSGNARHLPPSATAIFCHADVTGASMNDNIVSQGGVPPRVFPPDKPIYSGHFHKPHQVTAVTKGANGVRQVRCIEYLGLPYEVSLSEAQQPKALAVLDAAQGWRCIDRIPLDAGRRQFRPATLRDFLALRVAPASPPTPETTATTGAAAAIVHAGDRVVLSVSQQKVEVTAPTKAAPKKAAPTKASPTKAAPTKAAPTKAAPTATAPTGSALTATAQRQKMQKR